VQAQSTFDSIVKPKKFMGFAPLSDTISEDKNGLFALPLLYFTPDTRWAAGAAGVYYFKVKQSEEHVTPPRVTEISPIASTEWATILICHKKSNIVTSSLF
jgi:hypothetical protein